jgi:acetolactate synthase-1/2/3 large subunit
VHFLRGRADLFDEADMAGLTVGEALIHLLKAHGVDTVFGIPGVHTIELYRGLASSLIRHVTPRHEQGAAFLADGYARASGKPGVAFVITGPGLTNAITPMAQARADSIPMLVISGVNRLDTLGKGLGYLHELPDQRGMLEKVALFSHRVEDPAELADVLARAFARFSAGRPGPVHIEIPLDVMGLPALECAHPVAALPPPPPLDTARMKEVAVKAHLARTPLILAGGGARHAGEALRELAERLDAPVVTTVNARGLLHRHPLAVHASPSLKAVRTLVAEADLVVAVGTEFGPTDYDMYADGGFVLPRHLVRIDIDADQLARHPAAIPLKGEAVHLLDAFVAELGGDRTDRGTGVERAAAAREAAWAEIGPVMRDQVRAVEAIRDALPGSLIVGDSTQPVYAANLFYDHDCPGGWFNAATGYGALGYAPPAAIGAAIARPDLPVVCLVGDGGFQFTLPEIAVAAETGAAVIFIVWNNHGYREIETSMRDAGVEPVGVSPAPPDFLKLADAYALPAERIGSPSGLGAALARARAAGGPRLIEIAVD